MCGIFGFVGNIPESLATTCTDLLSHRGPDGKGLLSQKDISLGHRRLSILDLSGHGSQPMSYLNERFWITYNGEVYNFLELREELEKKGYCFKSQSDTEVILASFLEWKEHCLHKFNGMWAFAIWDSREKKLFLSRDRFGKKPLFYTVSKKGFAFASEMKALLPLLDRAVPNDRLISRPDLVFKYESTEECLIENVKRFPAGHFGWYSDGRMTLSRWWNTLDNLPSIPADYDGQVEQFREIFLDSCKIRMRSDVPIGTALSGGLDSSAVISAIAKVSKNFKGDRISQNWQHAFVASFSGTPLDESSYARVVSEYIGVPATFVEIDPLKSIQNLGRYIYLFEDLYITSPIPFMMTYGEVRKNGVSVTLDGHGADELFGGYSFDYLSALEDTGFNVLQAYLIIKTYHDGWPDNREQFGNLPSKNAMLAKWFVKSFKKILALSEFHPAGKDSDHEKWNGLDRLSRQLYISTHETILPTLLRNYDRYSMANGVEIRMPFMDHRVVTFAFALPWKSKIRKGYSKAIVRDAVAPFMPKEIAYRKTKIGFTSPIIDWIRGPLKEYFLDVIESREFKECRWINSQKASKSILEIVSGNKTNFYEGESVWTQIMPFFWEKYFLKEGNR